MLEQFGQIITEKPKGMLRPIHWPSMATMDTRTGDGRLLERDGRKARELPRTAFFQTSQLPGHDGAVPFARLDAVAFHDDNRIEGWGWILDNDIGRNAALYIETKTQFHNSVDLAEVSAKVDMAEGEEGEEPGFLVRFTEWSIAATTIVGKPAFADAYAELGEEVVASVFADDSPMEMDIASFELRFAPAALVELTAALVVDPDVSWADFHLPETDQPTKIVVTADGCVFGHLGLWDTPHRGHNGRMIRIPRPRDNYASFNQNGPLTELGQVETGPIFFLGGHPDKPIAGRDKWQAYGGIENAWADVRVTPGRYGPWLSGRVRPGVADSAVYAARASRISGHWIGDELAAIVSVNVAGYNVPGSGLSADSTYEARFADDGAVLELVASFPEGIEVEADVDDDELEELDEWAAEMAEPPGYAELAVDTIPTIEMAVEAEQGLAWRKEHGRGGGTVALARARDIKNRKALSERTIRRMLAFFQRHEANKGSEGWTSGPDFPTAGRINWALWGGDAGHGWASAKLAALESGHAAFDARRKLALLALEDLDGDD